MIALLSLSTASAWQHSQHVWSRDDMPLRWWLADYTDGTLSPDETVGALQRSFAVWETDAPCAELSSDFQGILMGENEPSTNDGQVVFYYDDPTDVVSGGVLAVTYTVTTGGLAFVKNGLNYYRAYDTDVVFAEGIRWVRLADIQPDACHEEYAFELTAAHEIGHIWGMGHSCEEEDVAQGFCDEQEAEDALMFWTSGPCEARPLALDEDDIEGITALYGPYATFETTTEAHGGVPLTVCFEVQSSAAVTEVEWRYGDGTTEITDALASCHTYTEQGQHTVAVTIRGEEESCGAWEYTERERALVLACAAPYPAAGFDALFAAAAVPGQPLAYQLINQAETSTYGCIDAVQWDVLLDGELIQQVSAWSPILQLPEAGTYEVIATLSGPGGGTTASLTLQASEEDAAGCTTASGGLIAALIGLIGIGSRRRLTA